MSMSLYYLSQCRCREGSCRHVDFKKWPCHPVDFRGLGPGAFVQVKPIQQTTRDLLLPVLASIGQVRGSTNLTGSKGDKVWSGWVQDGVREAERLLMQRHSLRAYSVLVPLTDYILAGRVPKHRMMQRLYYKERLSRNRSYLRPAENDHCRLGKQPQSQGAKIGGKGGEHLYTMMI